MRIALCCATVILSPADFGFLLLVCAFGPLALLVSLLFARTVAKGLLVASCVFFLPAVSLSAAQTITRGHAEPALGEMGAALILGSVVAVAVSCLLSLVCGAFCVRTYRRAVAWLVPAALVLVALAVIVVRSLLS